MFASNPSVVLVSSLVLLAASACSSMKMTATDIQNDKMDRAIELYGSHLPQMVDNAMIQDAAIVDFHFVAHTAELSGTGAARLDRFTPYLKTYGGVIYYETYDSREALIAERLEHVSEYLALAGCDMDRVEVKQSMVAGRGRPGDEAIERNTVRPTDTDAKALSSSSSMTQLTGN